MRQNPPGTSVTAAYMVIENPAGADELLEVSCGCSAEASLHVIEMKEGSDSMVMKEVPSIAVPPGASVALSPGGSHVMLMGLSGGHGRERGFGVKVPLGRRGYRLRPLFLILRPHRSAATLGAYCLEEKAVSTWSSGSLLSSRGLSFRTWLS